MAKIELNDYLGRIDTLVSESKYEQAAYHCFYLLRQFPKLLSLYKLLGRIFLEMNELRPALDTYSRIISAEPDNFLNHLALGFIFEELKLPDQAIFFSQAALFLQPENKEVVSLYQRLLSRMKNYPNPESFSHLLAGIHFYNERNYEKAINELQINSLESYQTFGSLFIGLSLFENHQEDEGIKLLQIILEKSPYLQSALQKTAIYWQKKNPQLFMKYLNRLIELNPDYSEYTIQDNQLTCGNNSIQVIYQEWTGFQNSKLRTVWQQPGSHIIENDLSTLPSWLKLLPVCPDFLYQTNNRNEEENVFYSSERKKILLEEDSFFQRDYFKSQIPESDKNSQKQRESTEKDQKIGKSSRSTKSLDDAFHWLEKVVTEGVEIKQEGTAEKQFESDRQVDIDEFENDLQNKEETEMVRNAWTCFSTGNQVEGIRLYKQLIEKQIKPEMVQEDLQKLLILFPENEELQKITNERGK
ncbi:MAG TPA: hypothetical protein PKV59_01590 [Flexilinea sp.]|nr:hypothetical protein [Flexilinea sp.]